MITCAVVFLPANVTLESNWMCSYVNYHITMLLLFGSISVTLSLITLLLWVCYGSNPSPSQAFSVRYCATWALTNALLATGFEGPIILFYLCVVLAIVHMTLLVCLFEQRHFFFFGTRVAAETTTDHDLHIDEENIIQGETTTSPICSICLDTVTTNGPLLKTPCNHVFHQECLRKWRRNTCPLCRQEVRGN